MIRKIPFRVAKLETKGFRYFLLEEIYTEKMITLSNVSLRQSHAGDVKYHSPKCSFGCGQVARRKVKGAPEAG